MEKLTELYSSLRGEKPARVEKLELSGSNRAYFRLYDAANQSVIGVVGTSKEENHAFIYLSNHFAKCGLPVPQILGVSDDERRYIQSDLGKRSLYDAIKTGRDAGGSYSKAEELLLIRTIRQLPKLQIVGAKGLDWANCYPSSEFDRESIMFDFNYFKYCFLKPSDIDFNEMRLEKDFVRLAANLLQEPSDTFLYRDFQARNVMISADDEPFFIDYQGGRRGPLYYDLASFLWQASAKYPAKLRLALIEEYKDALRQYAAVPSDAHFHERLMLFVLFRTLQVLGAYGFRGYYERKPYFLRSIPFAIANLRELLSSNNFSAYPYLTDVLQQLCVRETVSCKEPCESIVTEKENATKPLVVRVFSFSYKRGIPTDETGNGGGYVFDCRATNNPGRYEEYKQLTGLDAPVIEFLERDGEILTFLASVYQLADAHVQRYIERGFTALMFCFGCTGGQHRSVYSAQHLAEHLNKKFGVEVRIEHREQGIKQTLAARK